MSLLYQALLKNNQNKTSTESLTNVGENNSIQHSAEQKAHHSDLLTSQPNVNVNPTNNYTTNRFVNTANSSQSQSSQNTSPHIPWFAWVFIAGLLLVVGLLGGYIYGNVMWLEQTESRLSSLAIEAQTNIPVKQTVDSQLVVEPLADLAESKIDSLLSEPQIKLTADHVEFNDDKKVEVALDAKGQLVSKVSSLNEVKVEVNTPPKKSVNVTSIDDKSTSSEPSKAADNQMALSEVPDNLKASFAEAIKATEEMPATEENFQVSLYSNDDLLMIEDLAFNQKKSLPDLIYEMHIFASDVSERWVKINGKTLYEGQTLPSQLTLLEIKQDLIVWRYNNMKLGQLALVDFIKLN